MRDGNERLARDVSVLVAMADQMAEYLDSDISQWPPPRAGMPNLTLGGYLLREHRLTNLIDLLSAEQQTQVAAAVAQFNQALADRVVRFETKANQELEARLRQWEEHLKEMSRSSFDRANNYDTTVETRAIIQALIDRLTMPPYRLEERPVQHLAALDSRLHNVWKSGEFVWPVEWATAYPRGQYWWLYGAPRGGS